MDTLVDYGWNPSLESPILEQENWLPGRITAEHRSNYRVQTEHGEKSAQISGRLRHQSIDSSDMPAVGDWVGLTGTPDSTDWMIHAVLPRRSKFSRKAAGDRTDEQVVATNVDFVWIVSSLDQDFSLRRIERYLTLAWESGASPVVVLTKSDLVEDSNRYLTEVESIAFGVPVHLTSSLSRDGVTDLMPYFENHATVALLGSSGVGKSTLINALAGESLQSTGDVRSDGKGRHTTTSRQLIRLPDPGGLIIDTPGMREIQLWDGQAGIGTTFSDVDEIASACRFSDCRHDSEPGCAVLLAVEEGRLTPDRLESFRKLQRELAHLERKQDARAAIEEKKKFISIIKSMKSHHPKYNR